MIFTHGVQPTRWYNEAFFSNAIFALYNATSNHQYLTYLTTQADAILFPNGSIKGWDLADHQLDNIRVGSVFLALYSQVTGDNGARARYKSAADFLYDQLVNKQKRTPSGGFWHKDPKYPNQMWLDGLYMAEPFRAQYETLFHPPIPEKGGKSAWDDIILQFDLVETHCRNQTSGLIHHGYDESGKAAWVADKTTGRSAHVWDRAQGWYFMALVDVMDWFPRAHEGYERLVRYYTTLAQALKRAQDEKTGGWWLVMDEPYPGQEGNYIESSGTAMYTYGLLKGMRNGVIPEREFGPVAERAYDGMVGKFVQVVSNGTEKDGGGVLNWEGTVRVGSLDGLGDYKVCPVLCLES